MQFFPTIGIRAIEYPAYVQRPRTPPSTSQISCRPSASPVGRINPRCRTQVSNCTRCPKTHLFLQSNTYVRLVSKDAHHGRYHQDVCECDPGGPRCPPEVLVAVGVHVYRVSISKYPPLAKQSPSIDVAHRGAGLSGSCGREGHTPEPDNGRVQRHLYLGGTHVSITVSRQLGSRLTN